jgi:predicted RNase H-like nuclease (RuvC/YqgF family)
MSLVLYVIGAMAIGYFFGFIYAKVKIGDRLEENIKNLNETINQKNLEHMVLKKDFREIQKQNYILKESNQEQLKHVDRFRNDTDKLRLEKEKQEAVISDLELLLLEIQDDYTLLQSDLDKKEKQYKMDIESLTQKANDLYMVKGTDELKSAKEIFDNLRDKAMKNHK